MEREEDKTYNYNTSRPHLILKEYGRNVQMLAEYISNLESTEERTKYAYTLIELMKQLNPSVKDNQDNQQRIWDHLHVMSDFDLEINGPFPKPSPDIIHKKPAPMDYNQNRLKFRHYGRNIEIMIDAVVEEQDLELQKEGLYQIYSLMRSFYSSFHKENMEIETIVKNIEILAEGRLDVRSIIEEDPDYFNQKRAVVTRSTTDQKSSTRQSSRQNGGTSRRNQTQTRTPNKRSSNQGSGVQRNKDNSRKQVTQASTPQKQSTSIVSAPKPQRVNRSSVRSTSTGMSTPKTSVNPSTATPPVSQSTMSGEDKELMRLKQEILERRKREAQNPSEDY